MDSGAVSSVVGPAMARVSGSKGNSGLQMEAVRLLNEDQVSPAPTTPMSQAQVHHGNVHIGSLRWVEQGPGIGRQPES